ncbi:MAG: hypothetical protein ACXADC_05860 [Candidatus Thorarchaeota archaeon]|jgi:hypothetical protein
MSGGTVYRFLRYAIAGAVALTLGTRFLIAIAWAVIPWNLGNPFPVVMIAGSTVLLMYIGGIFSPESPQSMILNVFAWIAAGYLAVVMFFLALPMGLITATVAGATTVLAMSAFKDENSRLVLTRLLGILQGQSLTLNTTKSSHRVAYVLQSTAADHLIRMLSERMRIPVSITRYEDCIVVLTDASSSKLVLGLFEDYGITGAEESSSFFLESILNMPILELDFGMKLEDYVLLDDNSTVKRILDKWPFRATLFPTALGPVLVLRKEDAPGILAVNIERSYVQDVIVHRKPHSMWQLIDGGVP